MLHSAYDDEGPACLSFVKRKFGGPARLSFVKRKFGGFSLLEVLMAVAIVAILATIAVSHFGGAHREAVLRTSAEEIQSVLRLSRQRAVSQQDGVEWGVHFTNPAGGRGFYEIFRTAVYSAGNVTEQYFLDPGLIFTAPAPGGSTTVLFSRRTGSTAATVDIIVSLAGQPSTRTIRILPSGVVEIL